MYKVQVTKLVKSSNKFVLSDAYILGSFDGTDDPDLLIDSPGDARAAFEASVREQIGSGNFVTNRMFGGPFSYLNGETYKLYSIDEYGIIRNISFWLVRSIEVVV